MRYLVRILRYGWDPMAKRTRHREIVSKSIDEKTLKRLLSLLTIDSKAIEEARI
jgi:hypothetical protein